MRAFDSAAAHSHNPFHLKQITLKAIDLRVFIFAGYLLTR
ncbi:Hypothetical protein ABZS17I87_04058 [Kosakonia cowanii]